MHVHSEQQHEDYVGQEVEVVDVLEEDVPAHANEAAHQLVCEQVLAPVPNLGKRREEQFVSSGISKGLFIGYKLVISAQVQ